MLELNTWLALISQKRLPRNLNASKVADRILELEAEFFKGYEISKAKE